MNKALKVLSIGVLFFSLTAHAEMFSSRCFGGTGPTLEEYMAKLKAGDACEDRRVPDTCEIKVVQAVSKRLGRKLVLHELDMSEDNPLTTIDMQIVRGDCLGQGRVTIKYDYNGCTVQKIEMPNDYDCG